MPVKIRLARRGRKKRAMYDVVIADGRAPRDGRFIEKIGTYNPNTDPASIVLNEDKAFDWVMKGAQPTDTVRAMLSYRGVLLRKHLQIGVNKGAITQEEADKRLEDWKAQKDSQVQGKIDMLTQKRDAEKKARLEAEAKVNEARAEALRQRQAESEATNDETEEETAEGEATAVEGSDEAAEETPAEEAPDAEEKKD